MNVRTAAASKEKGYWGASVMTNLPSAVAGQVSVMTFDFAEFFKEVTKDAAEVYVKFNIEGAEYAVLPELKRRGLLCSIRVIWMYLHPLFMEKEKPSFSPNE